MDISAVKNPIDFGDISQAPQSTLRKPEAVESELIPMAGDVADISVTALADEKVTKKPTEMEKVTDMTAAMNKFVQTMNANIRFIVHEKTDQLMVQVIDPSTNQVLKEFPSQEFLDTVAAIRDYVGILLDKKI